MDQKAFEICPLAQLRASEKETKQNKTKQAFIIANLLFARPILSTLKILTHLILTTNSPLRYVHLFSPFLQMRQMISNLAEVT